MSRDRLTVSCPAKVNLALSVGAPRPEDGLHPISSWMVAVGFGDTLNLTRSTSPDSSYEVLIADDAPSPQRIDWPIESDLAFRAHGLLQQHVGQDLPIQMELTKRIPSGAGLGGGSSDAAGMLMGLNNLFSLGLGDDELIRLGTRLGSDVGFGVWTKLDKGPAIVSGTGTRIEPVALDYPRVPIVLILPPVHCVTREVYRAFDRITDRPSVDEDRVRALLNIRPVDSRTLFNDLTEAAFAVHPGLGEIRDRIRDMAGLPVHLSGSGSAMFMVVDGTDSAIGLSETIKVKTGFASTWALSFPGSCT